MKPVELTFDADFSYDESGKKPLLIRGVALNAGLIQQKNLVIPREELQGLANSLKEGLDGRGAYIIPDHKKETTALLGRVSNAWVSKDGSKVEFEGTITDESMMKKIRDGLVTYLSSGIMLDKQICSICGMDYLEGGCSHRLGHTYDGQVANMVGRGITGREISTVLYPADMGAHIDGEVKLSSDFSMELFHKSVNIDRREKIGIFDGFTTLEAREIGETLLENERMKGEVNLFREPTEEERIEKIKRGFLGLPSEGIADKLKKSLEKYEEQHQPLSPSEEISKNVQKAHLKKRLAKVGF